MTNLYYDPTEAAEHWAGSYIDHFGQRRQSRALDAFAVLEAQAKARELRRRR